MKSIGDVLNQLRAQVDSGGVSGCTADELDEIEMYAGAPLPYAYRQFMLLAGKCTGAVLQGTDCTYPVVLALRRWAQELLAESGSKFVIADNMFVFSMHQGYEFLAFTLGREEDPPVIQYLEGDEQPKLQWTSFSQYLNDVLCRAHPAAFER